MSARRLATACLAAIALAVVGGCSSDSKPAATPSSSPSEDARSDSSSTTADRDRDSAKAAYFAYWQTFDRVTNPPNPSDPLIAQYSVDPARADLVDGVNTLQASGQSIREPAESPSSHDVTVTLVADRANFSDCFVDARVIVDASGATVNDKVVTKLLKGYLVRDGGAWKVAQYDETERHDGRTGCAA